MTQVARAVAAVAGMAMVATTLSGCSVNPTTGKSQFNLLSREQEIQMGSEAQLQLTQEMGGEVARTDLQGYIAEVGSKLAAVTEADNPSLPWEYTLLDSDVINAFALPGGKVFMSRGLASKMTNEAQLAAVLGHEVGHVTARHINDRMAQSTLISGASNVAQVLLESSQPGLGEVAPQVIQLGGQSVLMRFSRGQELEADALGVRYMVRNNYDPRGAFQVQEILEAAMEGEGRGTEFFSTHPYPKTRMERIAGLLQGEYAYTQNNPQFTLRPEPFKERYLSKVAAAYPNAGPSRFATAADAAVFAKYGLADARGWCAHCASAAPAGPDAGPAR